MSYLFKRPNSQNWYVRLQPPGQKLVERSLGTSDKAAAELAAADLIKQHKAFMYQRRQARVARVVHGPWRHEYTPGLLHALPDGGHVLADETTLRFMDAAGKITGTKPNGGPSIYLTGGRVIRDGHGNEDIDLGLTAAQTFKALDDAWDGKIGDGPVATERPKFVAAKGSPDDALLETYIAQAGLSKISETQAREMWRVFRSVVDKPLAKCTRDDGRKIVAHLEYEKKLKSTTLRRYMVPLIATVNLAIKDGKHTGINPFIDCVPNRDDADRRVPFDEADIKKMKAYLHKLSDHDQLLLRFLACTGVRRGEAFQIDSEHVERGSRYVVIGSKSEQSLRRVPLPADVLPFLPKKITGPLFTGRKDNAIKRIAAWMQDIGIDIADKAPAHSFRHRAQDRLRAAGCPTDIRWELLGHERRTVAAGYGIGSPVPLLKKWIDRIGF
jgi:integrase